MFESSLNNCRHTFRMYSIAPFYHQNGSLAPFSNRLYLCNIWMFWNGDSQFNKSSIIHTMTQLMMFLLLKRGWQMVFWTRKLLLIWHVHATHSIVKFNNQSCFQSRSFKSHLHCPVLGFVITDWRYNLFKDVSVSSKLSDHFLISVEVSLAKSFFPTVLYRSYQLIDVTDFLLVLEDSQLILDPPGELDHLLDLNYITLKDPKITTLLLR